MLGKGVVPLYRRLIDRIKFGSRVHDHSGLRSECDRLFLLLFICLMLHLVLRALIVMTGMRHGTIDVVERFGRILQQVGVVFEALLSHLALQVQLEANDHVSVFLGEEGPFGFLEELSSMIIQLVLTLEVPAWNLERAERAPLTC